MPLNPMLPADIEARLDDLATAIAAAAPDVAIFVSPHADAHAVQLDVIRAVTRHLSTDAVDVVLLNTAPIAVAGRILTTRRVLLDRVPFARHRYESLTARTFQDFRIRERRLLTHYARD